MSELVKLDKRGNIALITLNRPDAMNALSRGLRQGIVDAFTQAQADPDIRVAVLTGEGKAFCAGFDLKELSSGMSDSAAEEADNTVARAMEAFEGPVIAAVNGHAVTGGFELVLACDVIIASDRARFADTHARVGILPGWGLSQRLPRLIGLSRAKQLSLTGSPLFADKAYEWGLVNEVVTPEQLIPRAMEIAADMCECVPQVMIQYKKLIDEGYSKPLDEALAWEEQRGIESAKAASAAMVASRREGVMARGREQKQED